MYRRGETAVVHQGRDVERMKKVTVTWGQAVSQTTGLQMYFVGTLGAMRMTSDFQWWGPYLTSSLCFRAFNTITGWNGGHIFQGLVRQDPEACPFLGEMGLLWLQLKASVCGFAELSVELQGAQDAST